MKTVVLKFGGTSVGSIERIKKVCKIIAFYKKKRNRVVVVSSAMSGVTNDLVNKSKSISNNFDRAEYDALVSTGEQVSCALIAGRLKHEGFKSRSIISWQLPILTEGPHSGARISSVKVKELNNYLKSGGIPIITGFQGINKNYRITTIGRSGSDATAIMLAKFIKADECIIYTDVDGVYTTDPRLYKKAKKIKKIFYDEMLEMASLGSKVMQPTSVQDAKLNNIDIRVKSSFVSKSGTLITGSKKSFSDQIITGISSTKNDAKITIVGVKDKPGIAASIFRPLSKNLINVDMVVQNISQNGKETDLTFTIKADDLKKTEKLIKKNKSISYKELTFDKNVSKVSIILDIGCGGGLLSEPMSRLGASVTGIDASEKNIQIAKLHSKKNKLKINYICSSPEKINVKKKFDVILNMEIVEHVEDIELFLKSSSNLLKKNGLMFIATINKTLKSYIFAIVGAEYILRWLPIGTHEWEKFVKPEDLKKILYKNNLSLSKLDGMNFDIIKDQWKISNDLSVNYIAKFLKN